MPSELPSFTVRMPSTTTSNANVIRIACKPNIQYQPTACNQPEVEASKVRKGSAKPKGSSTTTQAKMSKASARNFSLDLFGDALASAAATETPTRKQHTDLYVCVRLCHTCYVRTFVVDIASLLLLVLPVQGVRD
jgi:hypothetical protein